ncbi:hypothetical protein [Turicimonas muris]|uniref:Uncharacterized protein n=1 Tax=Turicimonas muris TaxID=1796652 RepID=A0A227KI92_9BURK|nr:hypothetical protein [Turicimonas muris]OXE47636.1 hypothetical protein ADH67_07545 [Turicimonas muris]
MTSHEVEALSFEKSGSNPCWRNFPLFSIAGRAGMLKLMSDLISGKVVPEQLFPDSIFLLWIFSAVIHNLV